MPVDINLGRYILKPFVALTTGVNVDVTSAPASVGGVTLAANDRVFLAANNTATENGGWVFNGVGVAMTRCLDMPSGAVLKSGTIFQVLLGNARRMTQFQMYATSDEKSDIIIGTTAFSVKITNDGKLGYAGYVPAASGSQGDATELLSAHNVLVLGGDNYSAKMPLNSAYQYAYVNNLRGFTAKLFPSSGGNLGAGIDTAITLQPYEILLLLGVGDIGTGQLWIPWRPVSQTITSGNKSTSPSEDTIFSALTTIESKRVFTTRLHAAAQNPADSTSYFLSVSNNLAPLTSALRWGICPIASSAQIVSIQAVISGTLAAAGQFVTVTLHNKTQATSQVLTSQFPHDAGTNLMVVASALVFNANDEYYIELAQPAWSPNPTNVFYSVETNFRT